MGFSRQEYWVLSTAPQASTLTIPAESPTPSSLPLASSLPEFPDLLEERESVSAQSVSFLSPAFTYRIMLDLPGFSWGSTRQKGALLSAAHEHEDVS